MTDNGKLFFFLIEALVILRHSYTLCQIEYHIIYRGKHKMIKEQKNNITKIRVYIFFSAYLYD